MKVARKLLLTGATLAVTGGVLMAPMAAKASTIPALTLESITKPVDAFLLKQESNVSFDIKTEVDPGNHVLKATVTNKTDKTVVPDVTFNGKQLPYSIDLPLEPGKEHTYSYSFTGNNMSVIVKVAAEGAETATSSANIDIMEPVSFKATETNQNVIIGSLSNNSSLVPQTVYTKAYNDEMNLEYLEPGETRTIAIPHNALEGQQVAGVTIATTAGYESAYSVELGLIPELPIPLQ
jgi:hypothetical protein